MKIAVPVTRTNEVDSHFGHCEFYNVYSVSEERKVASVEKLSSEKGCGCKSNIAGVLAQEGVKVMLAGGIGGGAINVLNRAGIEVVKGCSGAADVLVNQYLAGFIIDSGESCQQHEHHKGQDHQCNH